MDDYLFPPGFCHLRCDRILQVPTPSPDRTQAILRSVRMDKRESAAVSVCAAAFYGNRSIVF
jgi:hypothetical protein